MYRLAVVAALCAAGSLVAAPKGKEASDRPARPHEGAKYFAAALDYPVADIPADEYALVKLLDMLRTAATPADADRRVQIQLNAEAFAQAQGMPFDPERVQLKIGTKLTGMRLKAVLDMICVQINGVLFVRPDCLEIVPAAMALQELRLPDNAPIPTLIIAEFAKTPLNKAVETLAQRYGRNVVVTPQADENEMAATPITADLMNVPFESAVDLLADMASLKVIFKANVLIITTRAHAEELEADYRRRLKRAKADRPPVNFGCGGFLFDPTPPPTGIVEDPARGRHFRQLPPV